MGLDDAAERAAQAIRARPAGTRWFLDCDNDADGLCAAAVMARALGRLGQRFQVRASRDKTTEAYQALGGQECDGYILLDKGTSHLAVLGGVAAGTGRPVLVVDHHNVPEGPTPEGVLLVNPRAEGLDGGRDASAATTAMAVALALDEANLPMAGAALAGAIGDWQHHGGWQGWNRALVDRALADGRLRHEVVPALIGVDLAEALHRRDPALFADQAVATAFLKDLGIDPRLDAEDLDRPTATRLVTAWTLRRLADGRDADGLVHGVLWDDRLATGLRHAFRIVDACGRQGDAATGLAFLFGDPSSRHEAHKRFQDYKRRLHDCLRHLEKDGTRRIQALQWLRIDDPSLTGMVAGLAMVHFLDDTTRPIVVVAPRPDGDLQLSTRGLPDQVAAGLDLGAAVHAAAAAVGVEGGGHPVASGTVVPPDRLDDLLDALDEALLAQGFLEDA